MVPDRQLNISLFAEKLLVIYFESWPQTKILRFQRESTDKSLCGHKLFIFFQTENSTFKVLKLPYKLIILHKHLLKLFFNMNWLFKITGFISLYCNIATRSQLDIQDMLSSMESSIFIIIQYGLSIWSCAPKLFIKDY